MPKHDVIVVRDSKGVPRYHVLRPYARGERWYVRFRNLDTGKYTKHATGEKAPEKARTRTVDHCQDLVRRSEETARERAERTGRRVLFEDAFKDWLELKDLRPSTRADYDLSFDRVYKPAFGARALPEIEPADIGAFLKALADKGRSARTRQKHLTTLRSFFRWAWRIRKYLGDDPTDGLRVKRGSKKKGIALTHEQARKLLEAARDEVVIDMESEKRGKWTQTHNPPRHTYLAILIALHTGLRRGNILRLRWEQVDLKHRRIRIAAGEMKADADHEVPIHRELVEELRKLLRGRRKLDPKRLVIGQRVSRLDRSFKAAVARAGVPPLRLHDLRHSLASWLSRVASYACLKDVLGHTLTDVTGNYVHVSWEEKLAAIDALPRLLTVDEKTAAKAQSK